MGRGGCNKWFLSSGILERKTSAAHKCKGTGGSNKHSEIPGKAQGTCLSESRQFSDILLPQKTWRENPKFKSNGQTIFAMVHEKPSYFGHSVGEKLRGFGRWTQQVGAGQRGLYSKQKSVFVPAKDNGPIHHPDSGHVCLPWKPSIKKVCFQIPPLASYRGGCFKMPPAKHRGMLCQPPLENYQPMAAQTQGKQAAAMHANSPILGFKCMVAPNSETARQGDPKFFNKTISGDVQKLLGRIYALSTLAPSLSSCIREGLQAKQVSSEAQDTYLKGLKSIQRYDASFKLFCGFCICKNFKVMEASLQAVAGMLLEFNKVLPTHTRFVYSILLLIPGMDQLTFSTILRELKRQ